MSPERFVKGEAERTLRISVSWCRYLKKMDFSAQSAQISYGPYGLFRVAGEMARQLGPYFSGLVSSGAVSWGSVGQNDLLQLGAHYSNKPGEDRSIDGNVRI